MKLNYKNKKQNMPTRVLAKVLAALTLLVFSTANVKGQYCAPTGGSSSTSYWLNNITTTGGITNAIYSSSSYAAYTNSYTTQIFSQAVGGTVNISMNASAGTNYFICWVDWNQNNVFTDPGETVFQISSYVSSPYTNSIVIPPGTPCGNYHVRFGQTWLSPQLTSCGPAPYGSYVDMRLDVVGCTPCSSIPASNTVIVSSGSICPNSSAIAVLANSYNLSGITYQWVSSTLSPFGPWTSVPNGTSAVLATPNLTTNTYFASVITCTNVVGSYTTPGVQVAVSPVIVSTIPYFDGLETITGPNTLPNCSWAASNLGGSNLTYTASNTQGRTARTGTKFASFYYGTIGSSYFYTNGIMMTAGVTYSASLWYQTEYYGYNNWTDLSILYGPTQTTTGAVSIASTNGPAISNIYKSLSGTFQVPTTGIYYVAIKGTTGSGSAPYLTWDDLEIIIPCGAGSVNTPTIALTANNTTICAGDAVNITAAGANTYTWTASGPFTGSNGTNISEMPMNSIMYTVMGTNTLTGCMSTVNQMITVNPTPVIYVVANTQSVCAGSSTNLQALGASSYTWSNGANSSNISVAPTAATTYTVLATGANGCTGSATKLVGVYPPVNVSATTTRNDICLNETSQLTAAGNGVSFQWTSNTSAFVLTGNPITVSPSSTSVYTVMATDANGCQKSATVVQNVNNCTGISEQANLNTLTVYPNPSSGEFSITTNTTLNKMIEVVDVTGKLVATSSSSMEVVKLNLKDLSNGVYYVKVYSNNTVDVLKVVKQ